MALSGVFSGAYRGYTYRVTWTATQSISGNYSQIICNHELICASSYALYKGSEVNTCTIDGVAVSYTSPRISTAGNETVYLGTTNHIIYHDTLGKKENVSFSSVFYIDAVLAGVTVKSITASGTFSLDDIPRATTATLSKSAVDIGAAVTITTSGASEDFTHKLTYSCAGVGGTIAEGVGKSYNWTIPTSIAETLPTSTSGVINIVCYTYNGSDLIGSTTTALTVNIPTSYVPTISKVTITDINGYFEAYGKYIQNKSQIRCDIVASGVHGSTISKYETFIQSRVYMGSSIVAATLTESGTLSIIVRVTDSRGRISETTRDIVILEYIVPTINSLSASRTLSDGTKDDENGKYLKCEGVFTFSDLDGQNVKKWGIYWGLSSAEALTLHVSGTGNSVDYLSPEGVLTLDDSYIVKICIEDNFSQIWSKDLIVESAFTLIDHGNSGRSICFGGTCEREEGFEVKLPAYFDKPTKMTNLTVKNLTVENQTGGGGSGGGGVLSVEIIEDVLTLTQTTPSYTVAIENDVLILS